VVSSSSKTSGPLWLDPLLILVVVILGYGIQPTRLPLIGDEAYRALLGIEMVESGDWVIAAKQGVPLLDRPPLQYWTFAIIHKWVHPLDPFTIRLTMVVITLSTALLVWWYARRFVSRPAAFLAGVAYPTMGHVFDLGRRAETDALFALLLAAALLVWHAGYENGWRPLRIWATGFTLAALAALTKGIQAPIAFAGTAYLFLSIRRDWRLLFHWSHLAGVVVFGLLIAIWQVPFWRVAGWEGTYYSWFRPSLYRIEGTVGLLLGHLATFPLEVLGATLPWSVLLIGLLHPRLRQLDPRQSPATVFLLLGCMTVFVPVWISLGGKTRYSFPAEPLLAVLCGIVAHQCLADGAPKSLVRLWRGFFGFFSCVLAGIAAFVLVATATRGLGGADWARLGVQPWPLVVVLLGWSAFTVVVSLRRGPPNTNIADMIRTFALASLLAIFFNGPVINAKAAAMRRPVDAQIAALYVSLPDPTRLVSFKPLHPRFVYSWPDAIPVLPWPKTAAQVPADVDYFSVHIEAAETIELPFPWEEVTRIRIDPKSTKQAIEFIVVGRRTSRDRR